MEIRGVMNQVMMQRVIYGFSHPLLKIEETGVFENQWIIIMNWINFSSDMNFSSFLNG